MRVYTIFDAQGLTSGRFFDEISHPPVIHMERVRPDDAPADLPEDEWPEVAVFDRRNDGIPAEAVEISEDDRAAIVCAPQFHRWENGALVSLPIPAFSLPTPPAISDRQFAQVLALDGVITEDEALAWAARGDFPNRLLDALDHIPETDGQRFGARMMLSAATVYERGHPLVPTLGALLGMDAAALDAVWTRGSTL